MPGCGYVCPNCNDTGLDEHLQACTWCQPDTSAETEKWLASVHQGPCCGDWDTGALASDQS